MKLIKPSFEIIDQQSGLEGIYKQIEYAGRTCYKSHDKITEDSAKGFVDRMIKSGHGSMLEHGTVYLYLPPKSPITFYKYRDNKYSYYNERRIKESPSPEIETYVTTNYRVLVENNWLGDLQYICEPTEHHEKRITVKFITSRGIWNEFIRHRSLDRTDDEEYYAITDYDPEKIFSFAQESQRYCNYSKNKFNNEIIFIQPCWFKHDFEGKSFDAGDLSILANTPIDDYEGGEEVMIKSCIGVEQDYKELIGIGWKPQQAREVLPNSVKTELIMTGYISDWKNFFFLRTPVNAHPSARELAIPLQDEFIKRGYICVE